MRKLLHGISHYLSVGLCFGRLVVQQQIEYPSFLIGWILANGLQWFGGIALIRVITYRFHDLAGWTGPQLTFVFGLAVLSHAIVVVFFLQTWAIGQFILMGEFDRILLRPMNTFFLFMARSVNFVGLTDLLPGLVIFLYGCHSVHLAFTLKNVVWIIILVAAGVLLRLAIYLFFGSLSFWLKNRDSMSFFLQMLIQTGTNYPLSIYPRAVQLILTFVIPVGFISFYPAAGLLGAPSGLHLPGDMTLVAFGVGLGTFILSYLVFKNGLKNYESAGN
jgi:ABC-2 type transport system permease protein